MPDPIDVHVGSRVRMQRTMKGITQHTLGESLGLTFQQIQKYERGSNRIGASRLFKLAHLLDVPVSFFFEDMPESIIGYGRKGMADMAEPFEIDRTIMRRETLELVRAYYKIEASPVRDRLVKLLHAIGESEDGR